jgi:hypothetical protein
MAIETRVGEVIEVCTTGLVAQCYELYDSPALGSLVKTKLASDENPHEIIYGVVYNSSTAGIEPGRRPIARGKDEANEEEIYRSSPQLFKLLRSEFKVLIAGFKQGGRVFQYLPSKPAHIHSFVYLCSPEEIIEFSGSFDFLNILLKAHLDIPVEELIGAVLRRMGEVQGETKHPFLVSAGKELASLLSQDYGQLKAILRGLNYDRT